MVHSRYDEESEQEIEPEFAYMFDKDKRQELQHWKHSQHRTLPLIKQFQQINTKWNKLYPRFANHEDHKMDMLRWQLRLQSSFDHFGAKYVDPFD